MISTSIFPGRYVQGDQAIELLAEEVQRLGSKALVIVDSFVLAHLSDSINSALEGSLSYEIEEFGGECSDQEISKLGKILESQGANVVIGIGGGKTLDTAKALGFRHSCAVVIVPTIASTDAPCSALSVIYNDDGLFNRYEVLPHNPDAVIVDIRGC